MYGIAWFSTESAAYFLFLPIFAICAFTFFSLCTLSWQHLHSPTRFSGTSAPPLLFGMMWWQCSIGSPQTAHLPPCSALTYASVDGQFFSRPFWQSMPRTLPSSIFMNENLLISIVQSVIGISLHILSAMLRCVCTSCLAVGVSHPSGRARLLNRASVFLIVSLHPGSTRSISYGSCSVPFAAARRCRFSMHACAPHGPASVSGSPCCGLLHAPCSGRCRPRQSQLPRDSFCRDLSLRTSAVCRSAYHTEAES